MKRMFSTMAILLLSGGLALAQGAGGTGGSGGTGAGGAAGGGALSPGSGMGGPTNPGGTLAPSSGATVGQALGTNPGNSHDLMNRSNPQDLTKPGGSNPQDLKR
jgi:hypothetical protein